MENDTSFIDMMDNNEVFETSFIDMMDNDTSFIDMMDNDTSFIDMMDNETSFIDMMAQKTSSIDKIANEKSSIDKIANEKTDIDKIASEKSDVDKIANEKSDVDKIANEKSDVDKIANETKVIKKSPRSARIEAVQRIRETKKKDKQKIEEKMRQKEEALLASHQVIRQRPKIDGNPDAARFASQQAQLRREREERTQKEWCEMIKQRILEERRLAAEEEEKKIQERREFKEAMEKKRLENKVQTKISEDHKLALNRIKEFKNNEKRQLPKLEEKVCKPVEEKKQVIHYKPLTMQKQRVPENPKAAELCVKARCEELQRQKKREQDLWKAAQEKAIKDYQEAKEKEERIERERIMHQERVKKNWLKNRQIARPVQENKQAAQRIKEYKEKVKASAPATDKSTPSCWR